MMKNGFRHLLLYLAVLLTIPQGIGAVSAAEPESYPEVSMSSSITGGTKVSDFYNMIMQAGADPWVYKHTDGYYYNTFVNASGIMIRRAKTITGLDAGERRLAWTPVAGTSYSSNVWAPEMHYLKDADGVYKWYIYFAADNGTNANHRMYVLENASDDPMTGTWTFKGKITDSSDRWAIDGTVLTVDEKHYFIWSGWEETDGSFQNLYMAEMADPKTIRSERVLISTSEYDWESSPARINEGPQVTIRGSTINLVYSANGSWTDSYCLGLITADIDDDLMDPDSWVKRAEPIFSSANGVYGPGHHSLTTSPDGTEDWIIYHAARWPGSGWTRNVRAQKFTWNADGTPNLGEPVDPNKPIAIPSGEPKRQRYEAERARLANGPSGGGPAVWRESTASDGMKVANVKHADDAVQFTVNVPDEGFYVLSVRNANGSSSGTDASQLLSVNGGSGARLNIVYSGWNRWGVSTAKVYLRQGVNTIRLSGGNNAAELDSIDLFPLEAESELLFESPGLTLGGGESRSLSVYKVTDDVASVIGNGVSLSSSNTEVVGIDGMAVTGLKAGSATVTATFHGQTATATVTVAAEPKSVQSVAIGGLENVLTSGQTGQLRITARYNTQESLEVTSDASYSSSNIDVAAVAANGYVQASQPGVTVITATYGGRETEFDLTVAAVPVSPLIQAPPVKVKTLSGVMPVLPDEVQVVYRGSGKRVAKVDWKTQGLDFNSLGKVQVLGVLEESGHAVAAAVEVLPGWGLDEIVKNMRSRIVEFSYPLGEGLGNYSPDAYDALIAELDHAERLSINPDLRKKQLEQALDRLAEAEAALLGSLNLTEDGIAYNAYRDFSGDETGKFPYGIAIEDLTNGASATVQEEDGNRFLRLTTTTATGKANLFLPYAGEVKAEAGQRVVIEYRFRLNSDFQYANGAMVRNDSGTGNYSMVTAVDRGNLIVQDGANKKSVQSLSLNTWYTIIMVADWDAKAYAVYLNDNPVPVAANYAFRHAGGSQLTGQRFGVDGFAGASIDFDDFKVMVTGGP